MLLAKLFFEHLELKRIIKKHGKKILRLLKEEHNDQHLIMTKISYAEIYIENSNKEEIKINLNQIKSLINA